MGKRSDVETKLLDIQGHTVYFPTEPPVDGNRVQIRMARPTVTPWTRPVRGNGTECHNRRLWHILSQSSRGDMHLVVLESIASSSRNHEITFAGPNGSVGINTAFLLPTPFGVNTAMVGVFRVGPFALDIAAVPYFDRFEVVGGDKVYYKSDDGWFRCAGGSRVGFDRHARTIATAYYFHRTWGIDAVAMMEYWSSQPHLQGLLSIQELLNQFAINDAGRWASEGPEGTERIVSSMAAPVVSSPVKHRMLITDLRKSLLSEKWSDA